MKPTTAIYLDHAATTPVAPQVRATMDAYASIEFGNPSSLHASGRRAASVLQHARERVARFINASPEEIIYTGSGTESDVLAIIGAARANRSKGNHIVISAVEHKAVLEAAQALKKEGFEVTTAPVDQEGKVDVEQFVSLVRDDTVLISCMLANNELGTVQPIGEIVKALRDRQNRPLVHTDACQAAGHRLIDVAALGVDLLTMNGSKIYGPKGVGMLYKRHNVMLEPVIMGGGQERGLRAGTESLPLIMGFTHALELAEMLREKETKRYQELRTFFINGLRDRIPGIVINGHPTDVLEHIVHVTVPGIEGESMLLMLDEAGVEVATGSACSAKDLKPSHVLIAIGQDDDLIHGSIRFSFGRSTTKKMLIYVLDVFPKIVQTLRNASVLTTSFYTNHAART